MMLAVGLSYLAFIILRHILTAPGFLRAFIMKWCWILSKAFSASVEMIVWFLSLLLLMCYITLIDLCMLNHPCILGMKLRETFFVFIFFTMLLFCKWKGKSRTPLKLVVVSKKLHDVVMQIAAWRNDSKKVNKST
jgi:hypothetical protein